MILFNFQFISQVFFFFIFDGNLNPDHLPPSSYYRGVYYIYQTARQQMAFRTGTSAKNQDVFGCSGFRSLKGKSWTVPRLEHDHLQLFIQQLTPSGIQYIRSC
jgi:hypothetical protein